MNEENYTSLELSEKLHENGCDLESEYYFANYRCSGCFDGQITLIQLPHSNLKNGHDFECNGFLRTILYPAYDILNDICLKYPKEFFNRKFGHKYFSQHIFWLIFDNKKQEAEDYIWDNCLFNPKNKEV